MHNDLVCISTLRVKREEVNEKNEAKKKWNFGFAFRGKPEQSRHFSLSFIDRI